MIDAMVPTTPQFQALKDVCDKLTQAKSVLASAQEDVDSLTLEASSIAKSIVESGVVDENYELAPTFEMKSMEKVDSDKLKELHPEIFERSSPHVDNHGGMAILKKAHGDGPLQEMLKNMDPELYREKANVTKAAVKKACTKDEYLALQNDGCLFISTSFSGEVGYVNKHIHEAVLNQHKPEQIAEVIEED